MAVDMFLKLGDIEGESKDSKHEKWIDVLSWSWGMTQSGTTHMGGGSGGGKVDVQDLGIVKYVDHATAALHRHCSTGKHIDTATFKIRKAGGDTPVEYVVIELKVIIVTSISQGGSESGDRLTENVTLNFGEYNYKYTEQMDDGSAGPEAEFGWNIATAEAT